MSKQTNSKVFQKFSHLTDQQWLEVLIKGIKQPIVDGVELPGFPSDEIQRTYTGSSGEPTLREAFDFYCRVKGYTVREGVKLTHDTRILDFGCGWGRIIRFFLKDTAADNLYGIDVDPKMIDICREVVKYGNYSVCNPLPPTEFGENSFDIVLGYSVFSHLAELVHIKWISEFSRILKPGGLLLVTTRPRYFIEFCQSLRGKKHDNEYYNVLANSLIGTEEALAVYDHGKFLYSPTGGGPMLPSVFYGESAIPRGYIEKEWTKYLSFRDFVDHWNPFIQALIVMQKPVSTDIETQNEKGTC